VTVDLEDVAAVSEAIQQGRRHAFALEDAAPVAEGQIFAIVRDAGSRNARPPRNSRVSPSAGTDAAGSTTTGTKAAADRAASRRASSARHQ
jgi:hypothetical protein